MGFQIKFIGNERKRKTTFNKRSKSLKKATRELATLCGIQTLLICFDPVDQQVKTWPENKQEIRDIIARYCRLSPIESSKYKYNLSTYLQQEIAKHIRRTKKMFDEMSPEDANRTAQAIKTKLQQVRERIQFLSSECEDGSNMATSERSDIDCPTREQIYHTKDVATNHGDQNRDHNEEETLQFCEHISKDEEEINATSQNCEKNEVDCHIAEPMTEVDEETFVKPQNCKPGTALVDHHEDQNVGYDHPYGAISAFNWHWMAMNYWGSQIAMNNPNVQYPLAFQPPPMPNEQYPYVVPIAVRPPLPPMGYFPFPMPYATPPADNNTPKGDDGE